MIDRHKLGKRSRNKGANYERTLAKKFEEALGVKLVRTPQSGGFAKQVEAASDFRGDIIPVEAKTAFRLHIEAKSCKTWALPMWLNQAESDCPKGRYPIVVFHKHKTSDDYVAIKLEDFFKLLDKSKVLK